MSATSSPLRRFWAEYRENRIALLALVVVVRMILLALFRAARLAAEPL